MCVVCLLPSISIGEECGEARFGSAAEAAEYLQHASAAVTPLVCAQKAFQRIAKATSEEAVPLLLQHLSFKRPLSEGEKHGIFMHGPTPDTLYPAVQALFTIGLPAESGLIGFLAHENNENAVERSNALYALLLIYHGNTLSVIENVMKASKLTRDDSEGSRLRAAAREAATTWCDDRIKEKCKEATR
ncbi:MAG: hypothetical protein DMG81_11625 [Acidobacteria bacterium]|nr:MAG: hypothetical protein DMG81_11625 [Acidobacteriota bacterium]